MSVAKGLAVGIFGFFLFLSLLILGFLITLNGTVLSPDFLKSRVNSLDMTELVDELIDSDTSQSTQDVLNEIRDIVPKIEPEIKSRAGVMIDSTYDYLLDKKSDPEFKAALGESFLNAQFVEDVLDKISLPELIDVAYSSSDGEDQIPEEFVTAIKEVVSDMEPEIKAQAADIVGPIFDYILGKTQTLDLMQVLRDTVLNEQFIVPLIDNLDLSSVAQELITGQIIDMIPPDLAFLTDHVASAVSAIEPTIKQQFKTAAGPFIDYLTGATSSLSIYVSLDEVVGALETNLKTELLNNPPAELAGYSQSELAQLFDSSFFNNILDFLPDTFEINESVLGPDIVMSFTSSVSDAEQAITDVRTDIDDAFSQVDDNLASAKTIISYYKLAFILMIVFIVLLILGIVLVLRDVKKITLSLGIIFLVYGVIEYAAIWIGRIYTDGRIPFTTDLPTGAENLLYDTMTSFIRPMEFFSLGLLILGIILILVSVFYDRFRTEKPVIAATEVEVIEPVESVKPVEPEETKDQPEDDEKNNQ